MVDKLSDEALDWLGMSHEDMMESSLFEDKWDELYNMEHPLDAQQQHDIVAAVSWDLGIKPSIRTPEDLIVLEIMEKYDIPAILAREMLKDSGMW